MKNFYLNSRRILIVLLSAFILITASSCEKSAENNYQSKVVESNYYDEVINNIKKQETNKEITSEKNVQKDEVIDKKAESNTLENSNNENKPNNDSGESTVSIIDNKTDDSTKSTNSSLEKLSDKDNFVINELTSIKNKVSDYLNSQQVDNFKDTAKGIFVNIVDFLFYDGEIKGVKFSELTDAGKAKILELASEIDEMITKKIPNYKENISNSASNAYSKASSLIKKGIHNLGEISRERLGEENYNAIIDAKEEVVSYSKNAASIIGNFSSKTWGTVKEKAKNWYENFRNS